MAYIYLAQLLHCLGQYDQDNQPYAIPSIFHALGAYAPRPTGVLT